MWRARAAQGLSALAALGRNTTRALCLASAGTALASAGAESSHGPERAVRRWTDALACDTRPLLREVPLGLRDKEDGARPIQARPGGRWQSSP